MNKQEMEQLNKTVQESQTPADATQRVHINGTARKSAPRPPQQNSPNRTASGKKGKPKKKVNKVLIIVLCAVLLALLLTAILIHALLPKEKVDDGRIHKNVYAAGVNLSGMTPEEAKQALQAATDYTYSQLTMTITILDKEIQLTPAKTGAKLNVDAVVEAAYNYGRTSSSGASNYISVVPYLNLNTDYIQGIVDDLGEQYSTLKTDPKVTISGEKPDMNVGVENVDTNKVHQTLTITIGTPEYNLDTEKLYLQIMDAYDSNIFTVKAECSVEAPNALDIDKVYADLIAKGDCKEPVDAVLNENTFEVTNEIYGYGFDINAVKSKLEGAKYGEVIEVGLTFIQPDITAELLAGDLFRDILAKYTLTTNKDPDVLTNLKLACKAIDGKLIKSGEKFSFNTLVGQTSKVKGYVVADSGVRAINDGDYGGGISLLASGIYYCAVFSDMDVSDRTSHLYASNYISLGLDADVSYGVQDLIFTNTSHRPIRVNAKVSSKGVLTVTFEGTFNEEYTVKVSTTKTKTLNPTTLFQQMTIDNTAGYLNGTVLVESITGYEISVYRTYKYSADSSSEKKLVSTSTYAKRNAVIVELVLPEPEPTVPPTSEPTTPPETTDGTITG